MVLCRAAGQAPGRHAKEIDPPVERASVKKNVFDQHVFVQSFIL